MELERKNRIRKKKKTPLRSSLPPHNRISIENHVSKVKLKLWTCQLSQDWIAHKPDPLVVYERPSTPPSESTAMFPVISNLLEIKRKKIRHSLTCTLLVWGSRVVPKGLISRDNHAQSYHCFPVISLARSMVMWRRLHSSRGPVISTRVCVRVFQTVMRSVIH